MVKIFVAQTHEKDRSALTDFLKASGRDVQSYGTDPMSLTWLAREMMFVNEPSVIATSQRDMAGHPYISNLLHAVAFNLPKPTLTIVYTRAAAHRAYMEEVRQFVASLVSIPNHQLKIVPKSDEIRQADEHEVISGHINSFDRSLTAR